ncbi:vicilin-like seed storage protein At2g18540 [Impatiens glandulifera]|uniref:vicilin-like seed storage protein At2g18540 n=1 Tax=Impatiens glandulifera TaxID=253017 RepID=UPI001FB185D8|nr:vicilin-like seed storage protein At2g18540 [Impatiens glandulifera]
MITMFFKKPLFSLTCFIIVFFLACVSITSAIHRYEAVAGYGGSSTVVKKDERQILVSTEFGQISAVNVSDGIGGQYHLQFITLEPNALFLPVILHADMVFYVHTGSGSLSWLEVEADNTNNLDLERGDVYGLPAGSIFYLQSSLEPERQKLRIYAMFVNSNEAAFQEPVLPMGTYSSIRDLLLGFDKKVLQSAFQVSAEAIEELMSSERQPPIVHSVVSKREEEKEEKKKKKKKGGKQLIESRFMEAVMGSRSYRMLFNFNEETMNKKGKGKKKKKTSTFNFMNADPDFQNCNGWSLAVTSNNLQALRTPDVGLFMVNLTRGAMMGPHWNPMAMELGIVTHGQGMVLTVSSSHGEIKSERVKVEEGDIFVVPRFQMMAQLAFNNDSFVFMGFSTTSRINHPQYVAGKASVLQVLDRKVLAMSFNVTNSTMDQILNPAVESIILECGSCAEEEERIMNEEIRKEEDRKREEEEAKKREEEEAAAARKREEEEAAARKKEEEEEAARKKEEEEELRKREEEEARKRKEEEEEEARKKEEEEEMRKREEEEARKREEEEEARKRKEEEEEEARKREEGEAKKREEEEAKKREEEEMRKREEEEEEEARKRKEEEEAARRREEEEEEAKWEEEEARKREKEQEEAQRRKEEEEVKKREEEAIRRKEEEEEEAKREEEEARKREKEQEEAQRRKEEEEEAKKREEEEEEAKREEEEVRKREKEQEEAQRRKEEEEEEARQSEKEQEEEAQRVREEAIRRIEEEKAKREEEEEVRKREEKQQEEEEEWKGEGEGEETA